MSFMNILARISPGLVVCLVALVVTFWRLRGQAYARTASTLAYSSLLIAGLLTFGNVVIEIQKESSLAAKGMDSSKVTVPGNLEKWFDPGNGDIVHEFTEEDKAVRDEIRDTADVHMWWLIGIQAVFHSIGIALLSVAIVADRRGEEPVKESKSNFRAVRAIVTSLCLLLLFVFWVWYWTNSFRRSAILMRLDGEPVELIYVLWGIHWLLPWLGRTLPLWMPACIGLKMVITKEGVPRAAKHYAISGFCLYLVALVFEGMALYLIDTRSFNEVGSFFFASKVFSFASIPLLTAAIIVGRQPNRVIVPTSRTQLEDPLRELRRLIRWIACGIALVCTVGAVSVALWTHAKPNWPVIVVLGVVSVSVLMKALILTFLMPKQAPSAIYLRSFRNDPNSYPVRVAIQEALGPRYRMTGIRDPRRRTDSYAEFIVGPALWALRYCTPKFMDLEAGADWKLRLWNTLQAGRMAIVDVSDLTPFVHDEIRIAVEALGIERVLFVIDESRPRKEWEQIVQKQIGEQPVEKLNFANWSAGGEDFRADVRAFAAQLPTTLPWPKVPPGHCGQAFRVPWAERRALTFLLVFCVLQILVSTAATVAGEVAGGNNLGKPGDIARHCAIGVELMISVWVLWNLAVYAFEVGVSYERRKALIVLIAFTILTAGIGAVYFARP